MEQKDQFTLGIDLGGTSIRVGLYDAGMRLRDSRHLPTRVAAGPQVSVEEMANAVRSLLRKADCDPANVLGVGIGSPGPINLHSGVLGRLPNLPGWEDFPLRDALADATRLPVVLESDANAAAIGEWKLGAGREARIDSMAMITLGTGVGSGLILLGQVWHGMYGMAGEVGHTTVQVDGLLCGCGTRGCLEMYASANGLVRLARSIADSEQGSAGLKELCARGAACTAQAVAALAEGKNDSGAKLAFDRLGFYLGIGIANLINTLDLPMIVVGGGVASAWPLFSPSMFRAVREFSMVYRLVEPTQWETQETNRTFIRPAQLGPAAGLLGAGILPRLKAQAGQSFHAASTPEMAR